ncbi:predicted protein [Nematostella vectensis]|uniref:Protein CutA homolog n=2 Tax=Nematostella vectensis TaxID=45351 RepID=A7SSM1_NEMVE|nr:predicted protein [Nematostella vectensis]|eukprot:XP_001625399.1 predicted protein [Nematostella vectensis]
MADNSGCGVYSACFITCPNMETAKALARSVVEENIAACVNLIPGITSVYMYEKKFQEDSEVLMMVKTRSSRVPHLVEYIKKNHPYDVPEIISTPIEQGNPAYLSWIGENVPR